MGFTHALQLFVALSVANLRRLFTLFKAARLTSRASVTDVLRTGFQSSTQPLRNLLSIRRKRSCQSRWHSETTD